MTLSLHELAQINASLCCTIAAIIETKEETKDSVSLDPIALEKIYTKLDPIALEKIYTKFSILSDRLLQIERKRRREAGEWEGKEEEEVEDLVI